jgi:hypothetical protein
MRDTRAALLVALILSTSACGKNETSGTCQYPEGVTLATDASVIGCVAGAPGQLCEQSASGTTCSSACATGEFQMTCRADDPALSPTPATNLHCKILPLPTPMGVSVYCCPCAN